MLLNSTAYFPFHGTDENGKVKHHATGVAHTETAILETRITAPTLLFQNHDSKFSFAISHSCCGGNAGPPATLQSFSQKGDGTKICDSRAGGCDRLSLPSRQTLQERPDSVPDRRLTSATIWPSQRRCLFLRERPKFGQVVRTRLLVGGIVSDHPA